MTQVGIELAGGQVHADPDWTIAFDAAVQDLARQIGPERTRIRRAYG
jgi:hypothetical protein